ncbi:MAG: O-antigen ligase family protein, partial [Desulfobacterales bacterium]
RQKLIIDYVTLLMIVLLAVTVASSFFAIDQDLAFLWVLNYLLEGVAIYFLFVNVIRTQRVLKKVIWVLVIAGAMLGSFSLYQEFFNDYHTTFGGLAQRSKEVEFEDEFYGDIYGQGKFFKTRDKVRGKNRSGGPLGKANRYAQIMLVLVPLGLFRYWSEDKKRLKYFAAIGTVIILSGGVLLTYSRGGFLTLVLMVLLLLIFRYVRFHQLLLSILVLIVLMTVAAPGYLVRIKSIQGVEGLFSNSAAVRPDGTTKGRLTEMLAALMAFLDYPILGVGPSQYTPYYSEEYQNDPDIAFRFLGRKRRAHILYFELAAETGILGIGTFLAIAILVMYRLWTVRRKTIAEHPVFANMVTSLWFSMVAYLGTAVFLHLSYQRYYWFVVALSGAAIQIYENEIKEAKSKQPANKKLKTQSVFSQRKPALAGNGLINWENPKKSVNDSTAYHPANPIFRNGSSE